MPDKSDFPFSREVAPNEVQREEVVRPFSLQEFQGQQGLKENLSIFIKAAQAREEPLDHLFLSGPPGLGKTTLARIVARELGVEIRITSAPALEKTKDLAGLLTTITAKTIFFIDEIHRLKPPIEEMLYTAMEDFELDWVIGQGPAARTIRIPIPPFTMVGATTRPGRVSAPLHARFGITVRIDLYTPQELDLVLERSSRLLGMKIDRPARLLLAACSRGTPRIANRLLRRMRDFAQIAGKKGLEPVCIREGLHRLGIDDHGLDKTDRAILRAIIENYEGGPVGVETIAIAIGEGSDTLEDFYEPFLIQKGFLQRTPRGRVATRLAYQHLGIAMKKRQKNENRELLF